MYQPVTVRLVFKTKINHYLSYFIWHADIGQNIVNYYYKNQHTKWYKILNKIWKNRIFKIKVFQNEEETEFPLLIHLKNACFHFEVDWKQTWKEVGASWEIICCKAFLRRGESPPLAQSQGRWVRHRREEEAKDKPGWVLLQETGEGRDEAASAPSQNNLKGNVFCFKVT